MDAQGQKMEMAAQIEQLKAQMAEVKAAAEEAAAWGGEWGWSDGLGLPVMDVGDGNFLVRWCKGEDGQGSGRWEIYLPRGCVSVGATCEPINKPVWEMEGHTKEKDWYLLKMDETEGETESFDGEQYRAWDVVVHAKTSAKMYGMDALDAPPRWLLYASATPRKGDVSDKRKYGPKSGDEFAQQVATIYIGEVDGETVRRVEQSTTNAISVQGRRKLNFELVWYFSVEQDGGLKLEKVYMTRNELSVAGMVVTGDDMVDVTAAAKMDEEDEENGNRHEIYAEIRTNQYSGENMLEIQVDPDDMETDDFVTWIKLYGLYNGGAQIGDERAEALANLQVYR